ncbi:MAG: hypothetical protein ACP5OG_05885, partial [Candidatus Nanoarchaeia archaeon]
MPKSKLEKILKGTISFGKYTSLASIGFYMGCIPIPNTVSISPDGRYVIAPVDEKGLVEFEDQKTKVAIIDTKNNKIKYLEDYKQALWFDSEKDKICFTSLIEEETRTDKEINIKEKINLVIYENGKKDLIENGCYGDISPNGNLLVYNFSADFEAGASCVELRLRDLRTQKDILLTEKALLGTISPDNKNVFYIKYDSYKNSKNDLENPRLEVCNLKTLEKKTLLSLEGNDGLEILVYAPKWLDEKRIVLSRKDDKEGDMEISFIDINTKEKEELTNNDIDDFSPQSYKGNIIYSTQNTKGSEELNYLNLRKKPFVSKSLGLSIVQSNIRGNKIAYVKEKGDCKGELYFADVRDVLKGDFSKQVNLSELIKKDLEK